MKLWAIYNQRGELAKRRVYPNAGTAGTGRAALLKAWDQRNLMVGGYGRPQLSLAPVEIIPADALEALREKAARYDSVSK